MIRPLTCLTLLAAAGSGLYLYQEKHHATVMDRDINTIVKATQQTRDRVTMVRAEWAVLNEPERLQTLSTQYLQLQNMTPNQFVQLADLGSRLPPVGAPIQPPADIEPPPPITAPPIAALPAVPMAALAPAAKPAAPLVAAVQPKPAPVAPLLAAAPKPAPQMAQAAKPTEPLRPMLPLTAQNGPAPILTPPHPTTPLMVQAKLPPKPKPALQMASARPREPEQSVYHQVYAPVVQAFASPAPAEPIARPRLQQAAVGLPQPYNAPSPYVGSALGMAHTTLAAPVPVQNYTGQ